MLFRFTLKLLFFVVLGRWMYAEAQLSVPGLIPHIDAALHKVSIPTHDQWTADNFERIQTQVATLFEKAREVPQAYAEDTAQASIPPARIAPRRMADQITLWGAE